MRSLSAFAHLFSRPLLAAAMAALAAGEIGSVMGAEIVKSPDSDVLTIGIADAFSPEFYVRTYAATVDSLMQAFPERKFRFVEIDDRALEESIEKERPDFLVSSGGAYAALINTAGVHQIATRQGRNAASAAQSLASLIIVRSGSTYRSLADLRNARAAIADRRSFDGWQIAAGELARQGLDPEKTFREVLETQYGIPDPATLVKRGIADAAVLSTCEYETLLQAGLISESDFRILNEKPADGGCARSTARYPDAVFSSLPWADPADVSAVTVALLSFAATNAEFRWIVCNDFLPTLELLKTLKLGPYLYLRDMSLEGLARRFQTEIILLLLFAAAAAFHIVTINLLVRRRTAELGRAVQEIERSHAEAENVRLRLAGLERAGVVAQLSSLFAHEIKQPLMNISLYAGALRIWLEKHGLLEEKPQYILDALGREVKRSADIVEHVRAYARQRERKAVRTSLAQSAEEALRAFLRHSAEIEADLRGDAFVFADPFEIQYVCSNFVKNALDAVKEQAEPRIRVFIADQGDAWALTVEDSGPRLSDAVFEKLGQIASSTKSDGLGFGLAIASAIAEVNGGHLAFARLEPQGLRAQLILRKCREENGEMPS